MLYTYIKASLDEGNSKLLSPFITSVLAVMALGSWVHWSNIGVAVVKPNIHTMGHLIHLIMKNTWGTLIFIINCSHLSYTYIFVNNLTMLIFTNFLSNSLAILHKLMLICYSHNHPLRFLLLLSFRHFVKMYCHRFSLSI